LNVVVYGLQRRGRLNSHSNLQTFNEIPRLIQGNNASQHISNEDQQTISATNPMYTNLSNVQLTTEEEQLFSKCPNFSVKMHNNNEILEQMKGGFQKLAHDIRWHLHSLRFRESLNLSSTIKFPLNCDKKEIKLHFLIPAVENIIRSCRNKYLNVMNVIKKRRIQPNLTFNERRAMRSIAEKQLLVAPSDKGGSLCG
jgi:hypothetical protein